MIGVKNRTHNFGEIGFPPPLIPFSSPSRVVFPKPSLFSVPSCVRGSLGEIRKLSKCSQTLRLKIHQEKGINMYNKEYAMKKTTKFTNHFSASMGNSKFQPRFLLLLLSTGGGSNWRRRRRRRRRRRVLSLLLVSGQGEAGGG